MSSVSYDIEDILKLYQGTGYGDINTFLRTKNVISSYKANTLNEAKMLKYVQMLDKSMNSCIFEGYLYRGVELPNITNLIAREKAFSSTSIDIQKALDFAGNKCCLLKFRKPNNIKCYKYVDEEDGGIYDESEYLLERNIEFYNFNKISIKGIDVDCYECNIRKFYLEDILNKEQQNRIEDYKAMKMKQLMEEEDF